MVYPVYPYPVLLGRYVVSGCSYDGAAPEEATDSSGRMSGVSVVTVGTVICPSEVVGVVLEVVSAVVVVVTSVVSGSVVVTAEVVVVSTVSAIGVAVVSTAVLRLTSGSSPALAHPVNARSITAQVSSDISLFFKISCPFVSY